MESTKIFIDTDNEITFILERIINANTERVCLVVPDRASVFASISGLKLIKRVVDNSDKILVVVTLDKCGAELAKKVGFVVVARVGEIDENVWEKARKNKFEVIKQKTRSVFYSPPGVSASGENQKVDTQDEGNAEKFSLSQIISNASLVDLGHQKQQLRRVSVSIADVDGTTESDLESIEEVISFKVSSNTDHVAAADLAVEAAPAVEGRRDGHEGMGLDHKRRKRRNSRGGVEIVFVEGCDLRQRH